ncbi:MAG: ABC-ATPase domain-containing protein [Longimicrobiales bacterium]
MRDHEELAARLRAIDGRGYKAYLDIKGAWEFDDFTLHVEHVQGDPYAAPSRVRITLPPDVAALPASAWRTRPRALGTAACLARAFAATARTASSRRGTGRSGTIRMDAPGQQVMLQTAVHVYDDGAVEARFQVGLPARGRRVLGREAVELLTADVPELVRGTLRGPAHEAPVLERHAATNEDAEHLRAALDEQVLVAFVADGALLPRRSGVDDRPLEGTVVPFASPESLRVSVEVPNAGTVTGMGIPRGVTLIVGGGFHGKSTLLRAVEAGVYNHRPGDGREQVVAVADAVKVRAEDGRSVAGVDISPFIDGLPLGVDTHRFGTPNASGSTSQAAGIVEALEAGAGVLLVDEDTSATNFMIRDRRMQALVPKEGEPITPFIDRIRALHEELDVSSVLVLGGSGDYLDVADTVVVMRDYVPDDVTGLARDVAAAHPTGRQSEEARALVRPAPRAPAPGCVDPRRRKKPVSVKVPDTRTLLFGDEEIDLASLEQLVSLEQIRAIGQALVRIAREIDGRATVPELLDRVEAAVEREGLDALDPRRPGDMAAFRRFELAAALNRLRTLRVD